MALHASCTVRAILMAIHHLQQLMVRHQAFVFRKIRHGCGHDHCCVDGRLQVLHQAPVTQPRSNEPQSDTVCFSARWSADMAGCFSRMCASINNVTPVASSPSAAYDVFAFCLPEEFVRHLARKRDNCNNRSTRSRATPCCDVQQTLIQSVHDPPIFGYSRFSY